MEKQIIASDALQESYTLYRHKSGLGILLYPMQGYSSAYAIFGTHYGSIDTMFKTQKEDSFVTVPEGVAHFLEHKLFESEEGDAFARFAKTGASANAYTSFEKTCYLFSTTANFEQALEILVDFVQNPYFTEQTVQKEQGIIGQEIKMYEDDPNWRVMFNLLRCLYHNHPVRIDLAGTVESIAQIDKDLLYRCYHTFYNLNNMVLAIAGNFDPERAMEIIESGLKEVEKVDVTLQTPQEPDEVLETRHVQQLQVAIPLFYIGYKEKPAKPEEELALQIRYEMILRAIAGKSSDLYREMLEEGVINDTFGREVFSGRGYLANLFSGESRVPDEVMGRIRKEIARLKREGISQEAFLRIQKALYGNAVMSFGDVDQVANELVTSYFAGNTVYDTLTEIASVRLEELNELLRSSFREDRMAISIIEPIA